MQDQHDAEIPRGQDRAVWVDPHLPFRYYDIVLENDDPRLAALRAEMSDADIEAVVCRCRSDLRHGHQWLTGYLVRLVAELMDRGRSENALRYEFEISESVIEAAYAWRKG